MRPMTVLAPNGDVIQTDMEWPDALALAREERGRKVYDDQIMQIVYVST